MVSRKALVCIRDSFSGGGFCLRRLAALVLVVCCSTFHLGCTNMLLNPRYKPPIRPLPISPLPQISADDELRAQKVRKQRALANTSGVFSLEDLRALGQTGDLKTDWLTGGMSAEREKNIFSSGGGRAYVDPALNLPSGNYRLPGMGDQAVYYDPRSGQVPPEFLKWVEQGNIERDSSSGLPKAFIPAKDSGDVFRASEPQSGANRAAMESIFAQKSSGAATYQEAQDRALGLGVHQSFLTDSSGKKVPVGSIAPAANQGFTDLSRPQEGAFDRLMKNLGKTASETDALLGFSRNRGTADYWKTAENALASNYETNALKQRGLREIRTARGLDPETGISDAEKQRISDTYARIEDPAQRAAFIRYQDPGNLTPELRAARYEARAGERSELAAEETAHPTVAYQMFKPEGAPSAAQFKVTYGSKTLTDEATGRETFIGNIPVKGEAVKQNRGAFDLGMKSLGGAIMGSAVGFATQGLFGAFTGAYLGAGGPLPTKGGWRSMGPHMMDLKEIGMALAFARLTGSGAYGKGSMGGAAVKTPGQRAFMFAKTA